MANLFFANKINVYIGIVVIIIITSLSLSECINNDFTNWDDDVYVINNIHIRSLSIHNILKIFSSYYYGGYIPVTIISFAINYHFSQNSARAYHLTNFILHLINSLLVFWVIFLLTKKVPIAIITGLFFGIHPLHIESVAWITERKDVLYTLFFLISTTLYIYYLHKKTNKFYFLSLLFFILSLLSKPSAISLPFILLLIDYFYSKRLEKTMVLKKIPFFLLSIIFAALAFIGQSSVGAIPNNILLSLPGNIIIALRIFIFYFYKTILPIKLSCLYPAPSTIDQWQSKIFLFSPLIFLGLVILVIVSKKITHKVIFGSLFFAFAIIPVIQLIPIGQQIADRYTYIPLIGLFYIFAEGWFAYFQKSQKILKIFLVLILIFVLSCFSFLSARRCRVWKNGITLWSDVIKKFPGLAKPYNNRAIVYAQQRQYEPALHDLNQAIALNPNLAEPYNNRGLLFLSVMNYEQAITDFNQAIKLNRNVAEFYNNRGYTFYVRGDIEKAISDFKLAINLRSNYPEAYLNRGRCYLTQNRLELALSDLSRAIKLNPFLIDAYRLRAGAYTKLKKYSLAITDFSKAIKINSYIAELYNSRGILYCYENKYDSAIEDFNRAIELEPDEPKVYNNRGNAYATIGKLDKAIDDFTKAISIDSNYVDTYYNRALAYFLNKNFALALQDLTKYKELGYQAPQELLQSILDSLSSTH